VQPCFGPNNEIVSVIVGGFIGKLSGSSGAVQFLTGFGCEEGSVPESVGNSVSSVAVDASGTIWIPAPLTRQRSRLRRSCMGPVPPTCGTGAGRVVGRGPVRAGAAMFGQALALTSTGNPMSSAALVS